MTVCLTRAEGRGSSIPRSRETQLLHQRVRSDPAQGGKRKEVFQPLRVGLFALVGEGEEFLVVRRGEAPGATLRHQRMVAVPAFRLPARVDPAE